MVNAIPKGFTAITPHIIINGGIEQLDFYKKAFGAVVTLCMPDPNGMLMHAEMNIGGAMVMVGLGSVVPLKHSPAVALFLPNEAE